MTRTKREVQPVPRRSIVFGELVPCEKCKQTGTYVQSGTSTKQPCPHCNASGFRPWRTNEVDGNAGVTP